MGDFYRVVVTDQEGLTVLELAAPVEMLRQFAPSAVAAALGVEAPHAELERISEALHERQEPEGQPKRRRRTKAEMEAERVKAEQSAALAGMTDGAEGSMPAPMAMAGPATEPRQVTGNQDGYRPFG